MAGLPSIRSWLAFRDDDIEIRALRCSHQQCGHHTGYPMDQHGVAVLNEAVADLRDGRARIHRDVRELRATAEQLFFAGSEVLGDRGVRGQGGDQGEGQGAQERDRDNRDSRGTQGKKQVSEEVGQ